MSLEIRFQKKTNDLLAIKKAAYVFLNRCAVDVVEKGKDYLCLLNPIEDGSQEFKTKLINDFKVEVLDQELRQIIKDETEVTRNLILAYTFSEASVISNE